MSGLCPLYGAASKMWQVCDNCIEEFPRYVGFLIAVWRSFQNVSGLFQLYGGTSKMCRVFDSCMEEFP